MTKRYVYLDSEFNQTNERRLNVLCFALVADDKKEVFWLDCKNSKMLFITRIWEYSQAGYIFCSFNVESEASALISLSVDPLKMKWVDLYLEYVMMSNHNNDLSKGEQYSKGEVKRISSWSNEKGPKNLAAALFKLCKIKIDSDHKNKMRDLIISSPEKFTEDEKQQILDYCLEDTLHLPKLLQAINELYKKFIPREHRATLLDEIHWRAECAVRTAKICRHGYPIDYLRTRNLADNVPGIIRECAEDINSQFPEILPFKWNKKNFGYTMDTKAIRSWVAANSKTYKDWDKTETGQISLSLEAWEKYFPFRHDFPRGNFGAQIVRYLKIQQSLRSFNIKGGSQDRTFFDYVGSDHMCRPYLGQYVAQSSRFQPASTGYLFLKPAFLRSLCHPPRDYLMGSIDYSSQEFLLAALLSGDKKMLEAYKEGDVYLYFAKQSKMVPMDATKESHKKERDLAKATVLGISYSMTKIGLSRKLTSDTGHFVSEDEAQRYIDNFNTVFSTFYNWKQNQIELYKVKRYVRLLDGFYMWGDNQNERSLTNMPIQGLGAAILRKSIQLSQDSGINIVAPLHDAAYIMFHKDDLYAMDRLADAMVEAFCFYFEGQAKVDARSIRLELEVWGDSASRDVKYSRNYPVSVEKVHIDVRGKKEYEQFKPYFDSELSKDLL